MATATSQFIQAEPVFTGITLELSPYEAQALFDVISPEDNQTTASPQHALYELRSGNPGVYDIIDTLRDALAKVAT